LDRRPWWHRTSLEGKPETIEKFRKEREEFSRIPPQSDEQLRHLIANYYGMISLIDHNVGRIMIALRELGIADDTIDIYTTDHWDWLGDHGLLLKGPMMYEGLLRVGMILQGPGIPAGQVISDPVSTLDLMDTLCDYAGASPECLLHSRSLRPLIEGRATRDF